MANWNPTTGALGFEWLVTHSIQQRLAPGVPNPSMRIRSTTAETIDRIEAQMTNDPAVTDPLLALVEVTPAGAEYQASRLSVNYAPNADGAIGGWSDNSGGLTDLWSKIDDAVVYPPAGVSTDRIRTSNTSPTAYHCEVASAAFPLTARVLRLSITAVIAVIPNPTNGYRPVVFRFFNTVTGETYTPPNSTFQAHVYGQLVTVDFGEINPITGLPWTPQDVRDFDGGGWQLRVESHASPSLLTAVYSMALKVDYLATENRVAVGVWERPTGSVFMEGVDLKTVPGNADNWAKPGTGDFSVTWREAFDKLVTGAATKATDISINALQSDLGAGNPGPNPGEEDGVRFPPPAGQRMAIITHDGYGLPTSAPNYNARRGLSTHLIRTDAAVSVDSQPYIVQSIVGPVYVEAATTVRQVITPGSSVSYLGVQFVVVPPPTGDSTLTVTVHRVSDDVQMGGSFAVTAADVRAMTPSQAETGMRYINGLLSAGAPLVSGTAYYIRVDASGDTIAPGWQMLAPWALAPAEAVSFQGATGHLIFNGASTDADLGIFLTEQPAPPTDAVATVVPFTGPGNGSYCSVEAVQAVQLTWTPSAVGAGFTRYNVERRDADDDTLWETIAALVDEASDTLYDFEARRGVPTQYRLRGEVSTGAFSEWAETEWVVAMPESGEMIFASNARPDLTVAYDRGPEIDYTFLRHGNDTFVQVYGVDYQTVYVEVEDRGATFEVELTVNAYQEPDARAIRRGIPVFDKLRAIASAIDIPYVCVLDADGNRFYAHLQVTQGTVHQPGNMYSAKATVTEVTASPIPVTIATSDDALPEFL